ncbi:MarR family winged helix-turn-helix transcriptional regulator [Vulgatibacter incomptus]|uniref:Transcriptional regulator, MarR family n=1 Tax=Vulgatibacter incomptus TaxID=1391653 RepID=A0A0K1PEY2_9BACT|nr:MarR family transcriptional regulator [Vulgatibacter incomptus]AKU92088.1 Transcriptional regulator, MarR family [Vulgatibacter incomptus]
MATDRKGDGFALELERAKEQSVGQLLFRAARLWNEQAILRVQATRPSIRMAHTQLLPHLDLDGTKLTELAARVGTSKQAVGELVDDLEEQGLLERIPDPSDRRAKRVRFTRAGRKELLAGLEVLVRVESELREELGSRRMDALAETLRRLVPILERHAETAASSPGRRTTGSPRFERDG